VSGSAAERLAVLQRRGTTTTEALAFFDALPAAVLEDVLDEWRGSGLRTGHPFDGLLERLDWYGKRFDGPDDAHPLLFRDRRGQVVAVDPRWAPVPVLRRWPSLLRSAVAVRLFRAALPVLTTTRPRARLRRMQHRGVVTATLTYDALPIDDVFRRVDERTLLGLMELRGMADPFFFVLHRVGERSLL
jgi:hypothetical protein